VHYSDPHEPLHPYGTAVRPAELLCNGEVVHTVANLCEPQWIRARFPLAPGRNEIRLASEAAWTPRIVGATVADEEVEVEVALDADGQPYGVIANDGAEVVEVELSLYAYETLEPGEQRLRYALEIEHLDRFLGKLRAEIARVGLADDVLLVFTADHGEGLGEHGHESHGLTVYDELLHVPLAIRPPAGHPRADALAANADALVRHVDVAPTILDLLDLPALPGQTGASLARPLGPEAERTLEAEAHHPFSEDMYAIFDGRHKLVFVPDHDGFVLFDLARDPDEERDVLAEADLAPLEAWKARLRAMRDAAERNFAGVAEDLPPELRKQLEAVGYAGGR
jgi:arylsulfatase A-like enzyme